MKTKKVIGIVLIILAVLCALYLGYTRISKMSHKNAKQVDSYPPADGKEVYDDGTVDSVVYRDDTTFYYFTDGRIGFSVR